MKLHEWIKASRGAANLNQTELGERLGVGKANVSAWENGRHDPSYSQILRIGTLAKWAFPLPGAPTEGPWPFPGVSAEEFHSLPLSDKEELIAIVKMKVARASKSTSSQAA